MTEKTPLVAIVGPTAMGKTALGIVLAQRFDGEIVSADSRQVYRGMDIGTAKPTVDERAQAVHHLVDVVDPDGEFNVAFFLEMATGAIGDIRSRGRLPFLVGGTGHYVWALLEGLRIPEVPPDRGLREELAALAMEPGGIERVFAQLQEIDPAAAAKIDSRNVRRVIRAIEVTRLTGVPFSRAGERQESPYRSLILGLTMPRQELYRRIDERVDAMIKAGWADEVRGLVRQGYSLDLPVFSSLGYQVIARMLRGEIGLAEAAQQIKFDTHRFARRQYAWFRLRDPRIHWLDITGHILPAATEAVDRFLHSPQVPPIAF